MDIQRQVVYCAKFAHCQGASRGIGLGCIWPGQGTLFSFLKGHVEFYLPEGSPFLLCAHCPVYREENGAEAPDLDMTKSLLNAEQSSQGPGGEDSLPLHPPPFQRSQSGLLFSFLGTGDIFKQSGASRVSFITRTPGNRCVRWEGLGGLLD